ncbi:MAG: class I SAM-dependent methyltransferase [Cyclobacteriaceae bacterium]|nr:class I SAM-dependent methyltransferase [Cyclobacteriaceae bacterium]
MTALYRKIGNFFSILKYKPSEETNINTYESDSIVNYYQSQIPALQEAEKRILNELSTFVASSAMLDIGIGTGRTTYFFAPLVNRYVGIDYSEAMVKACKTRFFEFPYQFLTEDVRSLRNFNTNEFDLVLFSFNGLDSISPDDRELALAQIKRVLKPKGMFIFSSHNLLAAPNLIAYSFPLSISALKRNYRSFVLRKLNPPIPKLQNQNFAMIVDGSHAYQIRNYWVKPVYQISVLQAHGFSVERVYDLQGRELTPAQWHVTTDTWLYYFCKKEV